MKKHVLSVFRTILFLFLALLMVFGISSVLNAKYRYDHREPHTETYRGFYKMKKDTVDVLILGTSHAASGFNPQDFYDRAGIRSYNLASSAQTVWNSYFWLEEALHYQKPSAVIFDCNYLFSSYIDEPAARKALDYMRPGRVKLEAAVTNCSLDTGTEESVISYFAPYIRYHSRWTDLKESDFRVAPVELPPRLKGFWIYHYITGEKEFSPIFDSGAEPEEMSEVSAEYLDRITQLCEENGIQLILTKTPSPTFGEGQHAAVAQYAGQHDLPFYDFNTSELMNETGYQYSRDMDDAGETFAHANPYGARKMSYYLAEKIQEHEWAPSVEDAQWDETKDWNDQLYQDFELCNEEEILTYLGMLREDRYTVFLTIGKGAGKLTGEVSECLRDLGLSEEWCNAAGQENGAAVIEAGNVTYEQVSDDTVSYKNAFCNGKKRIELRSADGQTAEGCSIRIDGEETAKPEPGLHIVVYQNERNCVIDTVSFDLNSSGYPIARW